MATITKTKKEVKGMTAGKFYAAPVKVDKDFLTIQLPAKVAEYFGLERPEIYWAAVNGTIQLSGSQPHITIPMMSVLPDNFIPQES